MRDGQPQAVSILETTESGVRVKTGAAVMVQPFANVTAVTMNAPQEYAAAAMAYQKGQMTTALKNVSGVIQKYRGLPVDWARQAMMMLGDIYVATNEPARAEAAYRDFQKAYPAAGTADVTVGLAGIDVARKDYAAAKEKIDPILANALKDQNPGHEASAVIGRAYYVSGEIKEQAGDLPGALEDYLRTAAVFPGDRVAAASAQSRADALRKAHGTAVP